MSTINPFKVFFISPRTGLAMSDGSGRPPITLCETLVLVPAERLEFVLSVWLLSRRPSRQVPLMLDVLVRPFSLLPVGLVILDRASSIEPDLLV